MREKESSAYILRQSSNEMNIKLIDLFRCQLRLLLATNFQYERKKILYETNLIARPCYCKTET